MKRSRLESLAILAALALGWKRLDLKPGMATPPAGVETPPAPTCPAGESPRWFLGKQIINGREVGPGWVCLPVDIKKL